MISPLHGKGRRIFFRGFVVVCVMIVTLKWLVAGRLVTVATFNIEEFPKSDDQIAGAFRTIAKMEADVIALQEITEPARFREAARQRLDGEWRSVFPEEAPEMRPGVLFNAERFTLDATYTHTETIVYDGARPVFEIELTGREEIGIELFVVHFKAGSQGLPVRREQYGALMEILRRHRDFERRTLVMGDFNSTERQDRNHLASLADGNSLRWLSSRVRCTGYWIPGDSCESFALDHVFGDGFAARALARGPCETIGCEPGSRCPVFHERVSDHCPLTVQFFVPFDR